MGSWAAWGHTAAGTDGLRGVSSDTPSSSLGLSVGWASTRSHWDIQAVAALWQCHRKGGDTSELLAPPAAGMSL